jgi:hypothetical protein
MAPKRRINPRRIPYFDDKVFSEIEQVLALKKPNEKLRNQISLSVSLYLWDRQRQTPRWAEVHKRLRAVGAASMMLYEKLNGDVDVAPNEREVLWQIKGLARRRAGIDLDVISEELERLCWFVGSMKHSKGGRPSDWAWNALMGGLADAYEEATRKEATVTENEHRAAAGERYSGQFVRVAAILDRETAALCVAVKPRPNRALGPALQRLLRRRSKTD